MQLAAAGGQDPVLAVIHGAPHAARHAAGQQSGQGGVAHVDCQGPGPAPHVVRPTVGPAVHFVGRGAAGQRSRFSSRQRAGKRLLAAPHVRWYGAGRRIAEAADFPVAAGVRILTRVQGIGSGERAGGRSRSDLRSNGATMAVRPGDHPTQSNQADHDNDDPEPAFGTEHGNPPDHPS